MTENYICEVYQHGCLSMINRYACVCVCVSTRNKTHQLVIQFQTVSPENIHKKCYRNKQAIFIYLGMHMNMRAHIHTTTKEATNCVCV